MNEFVNSTFFFYVYSAHQDLHSFPTRRSSDLMSETRQRRDIKLERAGAVGAQVEPDERAAYVGIGEGRAVANVRDRKSTRLNSSHANISYAVFCLKKKKQRNK